MMAYQCFTVGIVFPTHQVVQNLPNGTIRCLAIWVTWIQIQGSRLLSETIDRFMDIVRNHVVYAEKKCCQSLELVRHWGLAVVKGWEQTRPVYLSKSKRLSANRIETSGRKLNCYPSRDSYQNLINSKLEFKSHAVACLPVACLANLFVFHLGILGYPLTIN